MFSFLMMMMMMVTNNKAMDGFKTMYNDERWMKTIYDHQDGRSLTWRFHIFFSVYVCVCIACILIKFVRIIGKKTKQKKNSFVANSVVFVKHQYTDTCIHTIQTELEKKILGQPQKKQNFLFYSFFSLSLFGSLFDRMSLVISHYTHTHRDI